MRWASGRHCQSQQLLTPTAAGCALSGGEAGPVGKPSSDALQVMSSSPGRLRAWLLRSRKGANK